MSTLNKTALETIVKSLAHKRPRFCSEADFQFALGWKIQQEFPQAEIRFECPAKLPDYPNARTQIDIIVKLDNNLFPLELKHKLKSQGAEKDNCERMLHDIDRLKKLRNENLQDLYFNGAGKIATRFALWLSDNDLYWSATGKNSIHEYKGRAISWESYAGDFRYALVDVVK